MSLKQLLSTSANYAKQSLEQPKPIGVDEAKYFYQKHEQFLALRGCRFLAYVYLKATMEVLEMASVAERYELCGIFRCVMSQSIAAHFGELHLANHSPRLGLANNARRWLAFLWSMAPAGKRAFQTVYFGFITTYGCDFMVQVYCIAFAYALRPGGMVAPDKIQAAFEQALEEALKATADAEPD